MLQCFGVHSKRCEHGMSVKRGHFLLAYPGKNQPYWHAIERVIELEK